MNTRLIISFFVSWVVLALIYEVPQGRETYGKPIYAALLFFLNYYLLYFIQVGSTSKKVAPKDDESSRFEAKKQPETKSEEPKLRAKVFRLDDYKEQPTENTEAQAWVEVYSCLDQAQIGMVQSILVSREILTQTTNTHAASFFPKVEGLEMQILVQKTQEKQALEILKAHNLLPGIGGNDQW